MLLHRKRLLISIFYKVLVFLMGYLLSGLNRWNSGKGKVTRANIALNFEVNVFLHESEAMTDFTIKVAFHFAIIFNTLRTLLKCCKLSIYYSWQGCQEFTLLNLFCLLKGSEWYSLKAYNKTYKKEVDTSMWIYRLFFLSVKC